VGFKPLALRLLVAKESNVLLVAKASDAAGSVWGNSVLRHVKERSAVKVATGSTVQRVAMVSDARQVALAKDAPMAARALHVARVKVARQRFRRLLVSMNIPRTIQCALVVAGHIGKYL
jgi:hypothetical protein